MNRLRNASEDLWERTLKQIETRIGKMAYLSRLRNPETDRYEHHGMISIFGAVEAEEALKRSHEEVMMSLLNLSMRDQVDDVKKYLEGLPQSARRLLSNWERTKGYESMMPAASSVAQRELFEANMVAIIRHLRVELADGEKRPG